MAKNTDKKTRNLVIYQIFTRNYKEGTFKAIQQDLDRIQNLGVDYIYLLPIQPSGKKNRKGSMGSPYAIQDYRKIDPVQGTMEDFIELSNAIHEKGMKLMIDVVYNHTSPDSWLSIHHPEWFYHKEDGSFGNRVGEWWDVIDLDYANDELWDYQIETLKIWANYVDGFRCDVASLVPLDFWKKARKEVGKDILWLAESIDTGFVRYCRKQGYDVASDSELYQAFDILYDYDVFHLQTGCIFGDNSLSKYIEYVNLQEVIYPDNYNKLRCLENHDRQRAAFMISDEKALLNWLSWIYFAQGSTMIYAGQEFECEVHPTLFDLATVPFDTGKDISSFMKVLYDMKQDDIFTYGAINTEVIGKNKDILLSTREYKESKYIGIFSTSGKTEPLKVDLQDGIYKNLLDSTSFEIFEKAFKFNGNPVVIKCKI